MAKLKVFGGQMKGRGLPQVRTIVAASSQRMAAELLGITVSELNGWWSTTGNKQEMAVALAQPGMVFQASGTMANDFEPRIIEA